jgi:FG-GAP repeat
MLITRTGRSRVALEASVDSTAVRARSPMPFGPVRIPSRALLAALLLSLAGGYALSRVLAAPPTTVVPVAHARSSSVSEPSRLPTSAWRPVSGALAVDQPGYRVSGSGAVLAARNPSQDLRMRFDRAGVSIRSRSMRVQLSVRAIGYGRSLVGLPEVKPSARSNRVSYVRPGLREWYANGPLGLEQGFTVLRPPARHVRGPLALSMALAGNAAATLAPGAHRLTLRGRDGASLSYAGLSVNDARGHVLRSWLELEGRSVLLRVDVRGARYPLQIDPFLQQGGKLTAGGELGEGRFGFSVALSKDGNTALIGGLGDNAGVGAAWIFTRSGENAWTQQAKLTGGEEMGQGAFGASVALSADGDTALIGGPKDHGSIGAVWVFRHVGETWTQQAKLTGADETGSARFGARVALSSDGSTALIGGPYDNSEVGAGWVFRYSGETESWIQQAKLTAAEEVGPAHTGYAAALSEDGNTAILGAYGDNGDVGAAWVFTRSGETETWTQQAKLTAGEEIGNAEFGESVALSGEGNEALIGGEADDNHAGAAWVFTRSGETWSQQAKLTAGDQIGRALFGNYSVALSQNGNIAMVSGWGDNGFAGAVWVFTRSGETWTELQKLTPSEGVGQSEFGVGLALSADGSTALIGGPEDNLGVGAAWAFTHANTPIAVTGSASSVTADSATLNATVNPSGEEVSDCHFEYGTTTEYGSSVACASSPGEGESPVPVAAPVGGLSEDTTYHFRIVATNPTATSYGEDNTFTTLRAPAEPPEYGRCVKLPKGATGEFSNSKCTSPATAEKHSFEWLRGPGPKRNFTTNIKQTTTSIATLETVSKRKVICTGETGAGEYTGNKTVGNVTFNFTGCEFGGVTCTSPSALEGELRTGILHGTLGVVKMSSEGPIKNTIGMDLVPVVESGAFMELTCGVATISVRGSVIVPVASNAMKLSSNLVYAESKGKQKAESFVGEAKDVLESSLGEEPFEQTGLKLKAIQTNEEKIEINSVA